MLDQAHERRLRCQQALLPPLGNPESNLGTRAAYRVALVLLTYALLSPDASISLVGSRGVDGRRPRTGSCALSVWSPAAAGVSWWMGYLCGLLAAVASCRLAWWALVRRAR